jgi:N-acetylglutamate synthase-like GNAT family acetyltransferase
VNPSGITIRRAAAADQIAIRQMIRYARLDPLDVRWPNFMVAETDGQIIGIGQIRPYPGCPELGSIVTRRQYRGQGIAAAIIETLLAERTGAVYLECARRMVSYYVRFGFEEIPWHQAPMPLKFKSCVGNTVGRLLGFRIAVMKRPATTPA